MHAEERRETILKLLRQSAQPVSASTLAGQLSVSRQIIVGDIALLRAGGADILATPRGYCLQNAAAAGLTRRVAVRHDEAGMEAELNTMVDNGCTVVDVIVEHPLYGEWVQGYSSKEYADSTKEIIDCVDALGENITPEQEAYLTDIFVKCSRYEKLFWDMAYAMEM